MPQGTWWKVASWWQNQGRAHTVDCHIGPGLSLKHCENAEKGIKIDKNGPMTSNDQWSHLAVTATEAQHQVEGRLLQRIALAIPATAFGGSIPGPGKNVDIIGHQQHQRTKASTQSF